ncbi:Eukaryotic translation initiation factor 4B [Camponotus floridanus]|uniref:Eukaryotic translation initiation factor 4B n=1 Tax=Camponotus floridanus TaxID=104421 RepID=E2AQI3_CAMFO|nr:eukaryotic translation initiation factor 4B isoform X1 [Camponotus floridanus]EFN64292.1 Eukaryotic translation initiation factor 4B [Camponotus floridanus]
MSAGKKGKKKKGVTVDLWSFLAEGSGPTPNIPLKSSNWVDDVEDDHEGYSSRSSKDPVILPTAPRAARGPGIDEENIPTSPPYVAYISNLPYDVDEADLAEFFAEMKISNMRLPKDANKIRGYGYVEFEDRQSLIDALSMTNTTIKTRRVRIEVSNSSNDDRRGGRMGRDNRRDNYDDPERTSGDWRSGPREELDEDSYRSRYDKDRFDNRDRRDDRERHDYDNKPGAWRERDNNDKGFKERSGFRDDSKDRDWTRFSDRGRSKDRDGDKSSSFGPRRNYGDSDWDRRQDTKPEPRQRPKLQLQPRTKPVESTATSEDQTKDSSVESKSTTGSESTQRTPAPTSVPAVNIFGAAKPVDTTAREREIEERLAKSYAESRSREEMDNKERKDGISGRRNGEGRDDKERGRPTWRSEEDRGTRVERSAPRTQLASARSEENESKTSPTSRPEPTTLKVHHKFAEKDARAVEKDRKDKEKDEISRMPKAKDEQAPNFVASNKYSMLPDDVDPDNIDE